MASLQDSDPRLVAVYRLLQRLAVGGMGIVYLAESPSGERVAVKLIRPELASDPEFRARFRREVEAARLVGGFHTAAVVDADPDASPPWMVTQYVPGPSLHDKVKRDGPLDAAAVHKLASALAEGLQAIHSRGLVHRDLKPLNIIMADDGPRIIDFGIAKSVGANSDPRLTATGRVVGTPAFLSPEQLEGDPIGPASDIFSLGSVLAFAATGHAPFDARGLTATTYAIVNQPPKLRSLDGPLLDVISACLAKDPARRPTASALLTHLYRTRPASPPTAPPGPAALAGRTAATAPARATADAGDATDPATRVNPVPRGQARAKPAPARAVVRHPALLRRAATAGVPAARVPVARSLARQDGPSQLQVRPPRYGWQLVTAGADGHWLAAANGDGTITVWLARSGLPLRSWSARAQVRAMTAGPGGLLVAATADGALTAWSVATGAAHRYLAGTAPGLTGSDVRVYALALDPSGTWLAASVEGRVLLWDVADPSEPQLAAVLPGPAEVTALAFDDTGRRLATGDEDGKVHAWDLAELADAAPATPASGATAVEKVALETARVIPPGTLPDASRPHSGRVLALAWDGARDRWLSTGATGPGMGGMALRAATLSANGGFAAMIDRTRGRVSLAALDDPARPRALDGTDLVITGLAFAGSGMLALGGSDGSIHVWNTSRRAIHVVRAAGAPVAAIAAAPNGTRLVVSERPLGLVSFDVISGSLRPGWAGQSPEPAESLTFQPDGTRLAATGNMVRTWSARDGTLAGTLPGRAGRARAIAADHDGRRIAAAWAEGVVTVWDDTCLLWELPGHKGDVLSVAFGPRRGLLVSAGDDETIRTWDLATGREAVPSATPGYRATVLAASPSGTTVAAGCADGTVRLYGTARTGELPVWADAPILSGHVHGITTLTFDISGHFLATASRDGTARIWDLATRVATTVLVGGAAAVASPDGTWHGIGETDGLIWQAAGLTRVPIPTLEGAP